MNLGEFTGVKLLGGLVLGAALVTGGLYFTVFKSQRDENAAAQTKLQAKLRENAELEAYRPKLADIERQLASLKQQLDIERRIVPDEKEIDNFMRMVDGEARKAGVEIRRYTSKPYASKEFYTEVPFEVEFDGPYYSMLGFFDRLTKVERIINVTNLAVASTKTPNQAKAKHSYQYAPGESVVATCMTTTYFSHDLDPGGPAAKTAAPTPAKK
jgi:type IV pilus assembly protein PilO